METLESMRGEVKTELLTHIIPFCVHCVTTLTAAITAGCLMILHWIRKRKKDAF